MRTTFFNELYELMKIDERIFIVFADMGLGIIEKFKAQFPSRTLNVGIAEQNLIGVCSGLCNAGFRPFAYTISNFLVHRCFEQIRNDVCLHEYPVTLVGASTGFDNSALGPTHHIVDDIGCISMMRGFRIYAPSTKGASRWVLHDTLSQRYPSYIRIGKGSYEAQHEENASLHIEGDFSCRTSQILLMTYGALYEKLIPVSRQNNVELVTLNRLSPFERGLMLKMLDTYRDIVIIEDQFKNSGLYSLLAQFAAETRSCSARLHSLAPNDYVFDAGDVDFVHEAAGIHPRQVEDLIQSLRS